MKTLILTLLLLTLTISSFASSINVQDTLKINTLWSGVDTVKIDDDIVINNGVTLTIDPGIVIEVQGLYDFEVKGTIKAIGNPTDSIVFTANDKETGWGHIRYISMDATNDSSEFKYCLFEYSKPFNKSIGNRDGGPFYISNYSNIEISNCVFRYNKGINAIIYTSYLEADIHSNTFIANQAYCFLNSYSSSKNKIYNNEFLGNSGGAAIYSGVSDSTTYTNNLFYNNSKGYFIYSSNAIIKNNTIVNSASSALHIAENSDVNIYNTILWDNAIEVTLNDIESDPNFYNCNIQGGSAAITGVGSGSEFTGDYTGCINSDPLFTDEAEYDYSLSVKSPCKDIGTKYGFSYSDVDFAGNPRICDDEIDLGAFEFYVSTDTICDEIWSSPNDTFHVTGNIFVPSGCKLTIQPGTKIVFDGLYKITVQGTMNAIGATEIDGQEQVDSIVFTAADTILGWRGIKYIGNSDLTKSVFKYCIFEYGLPNNHNASSQRDGAAFYVNSFDSLEISRCTFRKSNAVNAIIYANNSHMKVSECLFTENNNYSFLTMGDESSLIQNNKFINNTNTIYSGYGDSSFYHNNALINNGLGFICYKSKATIVNSTIYGCNYAPITSFGESSIRVFNTNVYGNKLPIRVATLADDPDFYNCNVEGGKESFYGDGSGVEYNGDFINCIDTISLFIDSLNLDFRLQLISPLIDNGTADTTGLHLPTIDLAGIDRIIGSSVDIGAYETDTDSITGLFTPESNTTGGPTILINLTFNKEVLDFQIEDIVVDYGTAEITDTIIENKEFTILITPSILGVVSVKITENSVTDIFGNTNKNIEGQYSFIIEAINDIEPMDNNWVYPNPTNDKIYIVNEGCVYSSLYDMSGNMLDSNIYTNIIDMSELKSGTYIVKLDYKNFNKIIRIVKK